MKDLVIVKSAHGGHWLKFAEHIASLSLEKRAIAEKMVESFQMEDRVCRTLVAQLLSSDLGIDHFFCDGFDSIATGLANKAALEGVSVLDPFLQKSKAESDGYEEEFSVLKDYSGLVHDARLKSGRNILFYETEPSSFGKSTSRRDKELYPKVLSQSRSRNLLFMGKKHPLRPFFEKRIPFRVVEVTLNPMVNMYSENKAALFEEIIKVSERGKIEYSLRYNQILPTDPFSTTVRDLTQNVIEEYNNSYVPPALLSNNPLLGLGLFRLY